MPSLHRLTDSQKLDLLTKVVAGFRACEQRIHASLFTADRVTRFQVSDSSAVLDLLDTIEEFLYGSIRGVVGNGRSDLPSKTFRRLSNDEEEIHPVKYIQAVCDLRVDEIPFPAVLRSAVASSGAKYLGELFYMGRDGFLKKTMEAIELRFDIPPDADPITLGWRPTYWDDAALIAKLNVPIRLHRSIRNGMPHYVGELFARVGDRRGRPQKKGTTHRLWRYYSTPYPRRDPTELWRHLIVPADWTPPNWKEDPVWQAMVLEIK
ncbi:MAG: hypothetical protein WCO25_06280 [Candidatus Uhrbacteria bacterium]